MLNPAPIFIFVVPNEPPSISIYTVVNIKHIKGKAYIRYFCLFILVLSIKKFIIIAKKKGHGNVVNI